MIRGWAIMSKGHISKVGCHMLKSDCPFAIYDNTEILEGGKLTPVEIKILST